MKLIIPAVVLLCVAGCNQPEARQVEAEKRAAPVPAPAPAAELPAASCDHVGDLFDMLVKNKAEGWTEADALADMTARGEYALGYVVDGVFGDRFGPGGGALARAETMTACRRMAEGGTLY